MPRTSARPKVESFNFRVDPELKAAFAAATAEEDKPAGQVLRDFMRGYVARRQNHALSTEVRRQSRVVASHAADPGSDEARVMLWIEDVSDTEGWTA
jgi:c-di-GMP-binding flagellar brake protein YcgR